MNTHHLKSPARSPFKAVLEEGRTVPMVIVGGGLAGTLLAIAAAGDGRQVIIVEQRSGSFNKGMVGDRSINLTLSLRGLSPLKEYGLDEAIKQLAMPLQGRVVHDTQGQLSSQPYGNHEDEVLYSVKRSDLNKVLLDHAQTFPNVTVALSQRCIDIDKATNTLRLRDTVTGEESTIRAEVIFGADGVFSTVRQQMNYRERANLEVKFMDWGYKEITIPVAPDNTPQLAVNALHVWPRKDALLLAMANRDGSFTCTCVVPFGGPAGFATLESDEEIRAFFQHNFPDMLAMAPNLVKEFKANPVGEFVMTKVHPWHYKGQMLLLGDASHSVWPFYGQGMNAAFEDVSCLMACMRRHPDDMEAAFAEFQSLRKRHTDMLADLAEQNFVELQEQSDSPMLQARKQVELLLNRFFPNHWIPLYTLIAHTTIPYADGVERANRQQRIARWCGLDLVICLVAVGVMISRLARRMMTRVASFFCSNADGKKTQAAGI